MRLCWQGRFPLTPPSRTLPLAFLAPDIVTAIIDGRTEPDLTLSRIKRMKLPASWQDQRQMLGIR